jgi:hypothetical protein
MGRAVQLPCSGNFVILQTVKLGVGFKSKPQLQEIPTGVMMRSKTCIPSSLRASERPQLFHIFLFASAFAAPTDGSPGKIGERKPLAAYCKSLVPSERSPI